MFLPRLKPNHSDNTLEHMLQRLVRTFCCTTNYDLIEFLKHFVLFEHHRSGPATIINAKVKDPLVGSRSADIAQKLFKILLSLQVIFVIYRHLCKRYDLLTLLQKRRDSNVFSKCVKCVEISLNFLVWTLLVKLFEMLPVSLEWAIINHLSN